MNMKYVEGCSTSLLIRGMHIKTLMNYYFISIHLAQILKLIIPVLVRMCSNWNSHRLLVIVKVEKTSLENNLAVSNKI